MLARIGHRGQKRFVAAGFQRQSQTEVWVDVTATKAFINKVINT
jgi:hypothetical protein